MADELDTKLEVTVDDTPTTTDMSQLKPSEGVSANVEMAYPALNDYFNREGMPAGKDKDKMGMIWDYFSSESESIGEMLYKLRQLENRLASPELGQSRLNNVYRFIKISTQIKSQESERDSILRK